MESRAFTMPHRRTHRSARVPAGLQRGAHLQTFRLVHVEHGNYPNLGLLTTACPVSVPAAMRQGEERT
jgi:hypothetical protein